MRWPFAKSAPETPVSRVVFAVLDLEMTGLDPSRDSVIALAGLHMDGGRISLGRVFSKLVRPRVRPSPRSVLVHQITWEELEGQPPMSEVLPEFLAFLDGAVLAGWCLELDLAFLGAECRRLGLAPPIGPGLDVLGLYQAIRAGRGSHLLDELPMKDVNLYTVARALGISPKGAHQALGDAFLTAQVLQRFLSIISTEFGSGEPSLETVLRLCRRGLAPATVQVGA